MLISETRIPTQNESGVNRMSYQVRRFQVGDLPAATQIYNAACQARESTWGTRCWTVKELNQILFELRPLFDSYTCTHEGALVGWAALTRHHAREGLKHTAEMSVYVQEPFRGKGVGAALARTLLSRASILNVRCILGMVFKDMPRVVSFAERKCGFSVVGCLPEIFSQGGRHYDILMLEKLVVPRS
ncbi:N-acetyltransferase family protein [Bradyrhizobium sp. USDA 3650]